MILATKFHIPPLRSEFVLRPRLLDRLCAGATRKLTLISAPAGYGKSTLLGGWIRHADMPIAWLSLDQDDNDSTRFLLYIIAALQEVHPSLGETVLPLVETHQPPPPQVVRTALINEINDLEEEIGLVFDDYHVISNPSIHEGMTFLLDHQPPNLHLFVLTRADPPLPLARLRGQDQLTEIRADDLRFTAEETRDFLHQTLGEALPDENLRDLRERTEGWVTGLQLAAVSMRGFDARRRSQFIASFTGSHHYIVDYLIEEVLSLQPDEIRDFLLQTSLLERLTGPLCDALTGRADGQMVIETLEKTNMFIFPLDEERRWFRYHQLFADALQSRLQAADPDRIQTLHQRVAAWFEEEGLIEYAIRHAVAGGLLETAADLVEASAIAMLGRGEHFTLLNWIDRLESLAEVRPRLPIYKAWALALSGRVDQANRWREKAEELVKAKGTQADRSMLGHLAAIRFYCTSYQGKSKTALEHARTALELLPENEGTVRGIITTAMGYSLRFVGEYTQAEAALEAARRAAREGGNRYLELRVLSTLSALAFDQCRLHQSRDLARDARELATLPGGQILPSTGWALVGLGLIHYEWNDLEAAEAHTRMAVDLGKKWGDPFDLVHMFLLMTDIKIAVGDFKGAQRAFEKGEEVIRSHPMSPGLIDWVQAAHARYWLKQGNLEAAVRWAQDSGISPTDEGSLYRTNQYRTRARVYLATEDDAAALEILLRLQEQVEAAGRTRSLLQTLVLRALAHQAMDDLPQALGTLGRALTLAEPGGFIRIFVDEGPAMAALLRRAGSQGIATKYVAHLLSEFHDVPDGSEPSAQPLIDPLSQRELEILGCLAEGRSNQEIAAQLIIALGTVKAHTVSIYRKLNVNNRTHAVARARELNLL